MKSNRKIIPLLVLGNLLLFASCRDCHEKGNCDPEYYRFDLGEARDYLWAGPGSYWIYRNTKTGELDTQTCLSAKTYWDQTKGTTLYTNHITIDYERLSMVKFSSYNGWEYNFKTTALTADGNSFKGENRVILDCLVASEGINTSFFYPFLVGGASWSGSSNMYCRNADTSISIDSQTYQKVAVFEIDMDDIWYPNSHPITTRSPKARYYWAKGTGLIMRQNMTENYSWELLGYKILP